MLFDAEGKIKRYDSPEEILSEFFDLRLQFYERRRQGLLQARTAGSLMCMPTCWMFMHACSSPTTTTHIYPNTQPQTHWHLHTGCSLGVYACIQQDPITPFRHPWKAVAVQNPPGWMSSLTHT